MLDIAESKNELARLEDEVLDLLGEAKGDILEDEHVIDTLAKTRETSMRTRTGWLVFLLTWFFVQKFPRAC